MDSWDDDNFEPPAIEPSGGITNKWEGEDEENNIKENWEDEEENSSKVETKLNKIKSKSKKQTLAEKIAEKERCKREQMEKRLRKQQPEEMSAKEKLCMQKKSDLKASLETTFGGDTNNNSESGVDSLSLPESNKEFQDFTEALTKKLVTLSKNTKYPSFVENLTRNICATMSSLDIRNIKTSIDHLYLEKQKIGKGEKTKKSKGKGRAKLKMDDNNPLSAYGNDYDDYDDYM